MSESRKLCLFNCDHTYKLEAVEGLLNATKAKLPFHTDSDVKKHYFSLAQMSDVITNVIPKLEMYMAFFVVHAHESRLSINEDNAGIGYANIYRALLQRTGGKVIIIIGGDDNYRSEDEEDGAVISRWAKRKISSQFSEEFLDGRKSFIFSWNKQHREIHEEALLHFFDPNKKGQKFEYQPKPKQLEAPLQKHQSLDEQRGREGIGIGSSNSSSAEQKRKDFASGPSYKSAQTSSEQKGEAYRSRSFSSTEERREGFPVVRSLSAVETTEQSLFSGTNVGEQTRDDYSLGNTSGTAMATCNSEHGTRSKETASTSTGRTKVTELAILGCAVSEDSRRVVSQMFEDICPKLNLGPNPPVKNLSPDGVKRYLTENRLRYCVLMVDAETVKDAYAKLPQRKVEYEDLLKTAALKVDEKVLILVCDTCPLKSEDDESRVRQTIERIITKQGKGFVACLNNGKLSVDYDIVVQLLTSPTPQSNPQTSLSRGSQERNGDVSDVVGESFSTYPSQSQSIPLAVTAQQIRCPATSKNGEPVLLRTILRYGIVSLELEDLQMWDPNFTVPKYISDDLFQEHQGIPEAGVRIVLGNNGLPKCSVVKKLKEFSRKKEIPMEGNETLLLKTRLRNGQVSFEEGDVHFRFGDWQIPQHIVASLEEEYKSASGADLIISIKDERLCCRVKIGKMDRVTNFAAKEINLGSYEGKLLQHLNLKK